MEPGSRTSITFSAVRRDGSIADLELACAVAPGNKPAVLVSVVSDITDKARANTQLNYLAFKDALTGLPNRALFFDRLRQTLVASRRSRQGFALLACDLDDFKTVNDNYGHEAGDAALQIAAERLSSCCREVDTVARMGGDEFVLILPGVVEPSHAALVANRVITAVGEPFSLGGLSCCVGVSVGIAFYPQNGQTIETLLRSADAAMYESKTAGKTRLGFADQRNLDASASGLRFMARADVHKTGIGPADAQHQKLAAMIGRLGIDFAAGEDVQRLHATFDAIIAFAQSHFADEEALMDRYEIENRVTHQQMHRKLMQDAKSLAKGLDDSSMMLIMISLQEWLLQHIESADVPLARRLHEKGYVDTSR
jgi:diguanylate cyclase (GGDEF)-like protein/hemerythrin-like metal-binding protein